MSAGKQPEGSGGSGGSSTDEAAAVQSVVLMTKDATHERRADHVLWLLNNLHMPLSLAEMENPFYEIIDVMPSSHHGSNGAITSNNGSRHQSGQSHHMRGLPHRPEHPPGSAMDLPTHDVAQLAESLDRKYKFTEDTVFWNIYNEYNVVFVIDMSQSMYSLDPNTSNIHIQTALETLEKCLMGMIQPFTVHSTLGLPDYVVEPHICASVVGYCPRQPGSYPIERGRKKLPYCRTLAHAHMVTREGIPEFMKSIRNFMFNYECEIQDLVGSFPPPAPPIPLDSSPDSDDTRAQSADGASGRKKHSDRDTKPFESLNGKRPCAGDTFTFKYDPDAPLLHTLQIADYFLKVMPELCSPVFVYLTDGVMRSNFAISKAQPVTSSLARRNTQCTFVQVGSSGGFTPETTLGFVGDNELLLYLAASLGGSFIYASDCPDTVLPQQANFYHQAMLVKETRLARTPVRHRYDLTTFGGRRLGDMPRERLDIKKGGLQSAINRDSGFPWCSECKPPVVDTVTARYSDYLIPVNVSMLVEARMSEGFTIRNIQVYKLDREGHSERVNIKMELVWHPNITVVYRITNTHYAGHSDKNGAHSPQADSESVHSGADSDLSATASDRGQRSPNMVDIVIRSYKLFTSAFLHCRQSDEKKNELYGKAAMLHTFLKAIVEKDERLRQIYTLPPTPSHSLRLRQKYAPPVFVPPTIKTASGPSRTSNETTPLAIRVFTDEVDPSVFLKYSSWSPHHWYIYELMQQQQTKPSVLFKALSNFRHTTSMFIDSDLILSYVDGIDFTETAKHGQRIMNDFRAHVCQAGTWALLKEEGTSVVFLRDSFRQSHSIPVFVVAHWQMATNWILRVSFSLFNGTADARKIVMDCLPTFSDSFRPEYRSSNSESVARATRPLHLLPVDLDITDEMAPNLLSTRDLGDLHTYVLEWRWTYLAREGRREDLSGEGSDREIVRQALHRLALTLGFHRLSQDFTLLNAKGESTGLLDSPGAANYDSCLTFYHEREGYDGEELLLACQYQIVVDMKQSSVTARTWIEPWSARFIRMVFEDDFRLLAPLGTFQQILQPERCFQLKVPNLAEFHSRRMNMFSIMAVVNSSRLALRILQMPEITPAHAIWSSSEGADDIKVDDPTYEVIHEPDPDDDLEIQELDQHGNIIRRTKGTEYYKTHDRNVTRDLALANKLKIMHVGSANNERRATLLERFMLTLFDKSEEGKYDPHIEEYRKNEYNPFILALINPDHPRKLFFNARSIKWMTTGEFTTVAYRCFLEFALFKHCDAISVNAERFNKLRFASSIVTELTDSIPGLHQATGVPNALDEHLYMDKWYVIRLPNNSSFLMVILPNVSLSSPNRRQAGDIQSAAGSDKEAETAASDGAIADEASGSESPPGGGRRRADSAPASPPVFTPALEDSIRGQFGVDVRTSRPMAINAYTLVMECSMDNAEMRRQVRAMDVRAQAATKTTLNLRKLDVPCADTKLPGEALQGFVGQKDIPIPFTEYALEEIKTLERMYSETFLQTIYLALLLKREVALDDLAACQQSTLWKRRSIDVDITAFLHSQDVARISRDSEWQAQDRQSLQDKFTELLGESFTPLPQNVDPVQGRYFYCKLTPDRRSELEICLQLAQNPLFINLQCSVEVVDGKLGHEKRLNMPIDQLPLSLERLCEQAGIPWRPPTDHFEPLTNVRVIMHINCMYLPDPALASEGAAAPETPGEDKVLETKPDKQQLESRSARLFQKTMSLSSLVTNAFDPTAVNGTNPDMLPSAVIAKQHINAQMATLQGLPHDQLELVRHCHRRFVRFIAQETLYALRDIRPVTAPLLSQVWHTIATTVDDEVPSDKFEFSHNKLELKFLIATPDMGRRQHALALVMSELLKQDGVHAEYPLGRLNELDGIVYMRDVRSRSDRIQAKARIRARALSDAAASGESPRRQPTAAVDLSDAIPSWFLIKPTAEKDAVRILTHNYSIVTNEAADNVLAATRQLLMVALKAANTRLLLEEMAETHRFPDQLVLPDAARANTASAAVVAAAAASSSRLGSFTDTQTVRDEAAAQKHSGGDRAPKGTSQRDMHTAGSAAALPGPAPAVTSGADGTAAAHPAGRAPGTGDPYDIASVLKPYIPDNPNFYACEEQFHSTFPLHPRVSPNKAAQAVLASGLMNNRLVNQRNMFFVRDNDSIFYALLTIDRVPYVNPFGATSGPGSSASRQSGSVTSAPTPTIDAASPACAPEGTGAHTVATTSPDPTAFLQHAVSAAQLVAAPAEATGTALTPNMPRRPSVVPGTPSRLMTELPMTEDTDGTFATGSGAPTTPRSGRPELIFNSAHRYSVTEAMAPPPSTGTAPGSPSARYFMSSLTNLEHERWNAHGSEPHSPVVSTSSSGAHMPDTAVAMQNYYRLPHTVSITSMPVFDNFALTDVIPAIHAEEKTVPCLVLHLYGVDRPRREMTRGLVKQIGERITVNVTMPEMSDMLLRRVALNDHDMNFLFPQCNPEPTILYLPLPRFVHDLDRLLLHMRQAFGQIVSPFPTSDFLAKAVRRTFLHLRRQHTDDEDDGKSDGIAIEGRVPSALRNDLSHIMDGWEHDRQTPRRVPVERMTFLYNFSMKGVTPTPEMTDIGTGIAIIAALPLTRERVLSKGIWERLPPPAVDLTAGSARLDAQTPVFDDALMISTVRRPSLTPHPHQATSLSNSGVTGDPAQDGAVSPLQRQPQQAQRRMSRTSSPASPTQAQAATLANGNPVPAAEPSHDDAAAAPTPLPASEAAELFNEYLRQFQAARRHLRVDSSEFGNLTELMDEQVAEFSGEPVLAITLWSNASVRLDRLSAHVSRVYWNALGDYVSEQVLYPILSSGWGHAADPEIRLPDPYTDLDACIEYPSGARERTRPAGVAVKLGAEPVGEQDATQVHLALLRTRAIQLPKAPSTFTESSKRQVHAMEIARQMAQYWGRQESVRSLRHHRQKLPRVTGISHWFSEELRSVLEAMCPAMQPALFRLLENPLVLDEDESRPIGPVPKALFPAYTLRKSAAGDASDIVYDVSALPKALKGTRQSFCIMCTLPLNATSAAATATHSSTQPSAQLQLASSQAPSSSRLGSVAGRTDRTPPSAQVGSATTPNRRLESLMKRPGESGYQRPSARTSIGAGGGQLHGLGLHGWNQSDGRQRHSRYAAQRYAGNKSSDATQAGRRAQPQQRLPAISERNTARDAVRRLPSPSDYKPVADPETPVLSIDEITHYATGGKGTQASTIAWVIVWLVGGELEMVGYNVSHRLWAGVCDQIKQRLERESRRKQLLGMFASHMCGIFPGYDRQARHRGIASTWLDRDVTRDLINKFALLKQLAHDDQIHYFSIERQISEDFMQRLGLSDSSELAQLVAHPPVAGMTVNDSKTELALRQLQPEHLRWARKLTFVDYTQPYVDTYHPDTLFRIGSRFMRAYQGRIMQVLRYDELMKIAERWRQLALLNSTPDADARLLTTASETRTSSLSSDEPRPAAQSVPPPPRSASVPMGPQRPESTVQAPARSDKSGFGAHYKGKAPEHAAAGDQASGSGSDDEVTLADIQRILENARLLHFVCAPLPVSTAIKPSGTDRRAFERLFRVVSAMLQDLADCYIDYLCSTGYMVARRHEKPCAWRDALARLGYTPAKIAQFTCELLSEAGGSEYVHSGRPELLETMLPSIQIPGAYLFVNTERSNLVTDIEVCPEMLSIRMHALSRFTSEWRSAVPGYVRSSISQKSIKKFTFELSKFKKLLHAKSFVYDFQLRYVASMLRPAETVDGPMSAYSSDSDLEDGSSSSGSESSDSDVGEGRRPGSPPAHSRQHRRRRRTVAQALHVHVDLTLFMRALSQQRYYSTRFSSRRLVRAQFPVMHPEMYEYFLDHSERYHFYTDGCRPPTQDDQSGISAPALCSDQALHSGCYRLYDGVLSEGMQTDEHMAVFSDPDGFTWPSHPGDRFPLHLMDRMGNRPISIRSGKPFSGANIASSAPEPAWKLARGGSTEDGSFGRRARPLAHGGADSPLAPSGLHMSDSRRSMAASLAPGSHWLDGAPGAKDGLRGLSTRMPYTGRAHGAVPVTAGQYVNVHATEHPVASPLREGSMLGKSRPYSTDSRQRSSGTLKLIDYALNEYAACRIHLLSNDSSVRVTLMALTPDCDTCRVKHSQEAQRRKQRLHSHDQQPVAAEAAADQADGSQPNGEPHRRHRHRHRRRRDRGAARAIDNVALLFGSPRTQFAQSQRHPYHSTIAANGSSRGEANGEARIPLQRWMASMGADGVVDPPADGLRTATSESSLAQISYYLIIDMDPQTTIGLSSLRTDARSRNGSLGPDGGPAQAPAGSTRTCEACDQLARQRGPARLCGIHRALQMAQVDMRDWENKGEVWASEPTMVMDSTVDPDEYDKEDPDVLLWIKRTARRLVAQTAVDYHRDFNWYLAYQHMRMADLPSGLQPRDIGALVGFIERQSWINVGEIDGRVQQLLALDIPAQRIIESLQMRMRHLYLESTLLMTTLQADSAELPAEPVDMEPSASQRGRSHFGSLGRALASAASFNATPPATPEHLNLSRFSTVDHERSRLEELSDADQASDLNPHVLPSNPLCPIAAVDVHGRIIEERSSSNIDRVWQLLSPLQPRPSRKILLDPAFQKVISRYVRLDMIDSPWLCHQHRFPVTVPVYNWSFDEPNEPPAEPAASEQRGPARHTTPSISSSRQQRRSRTGASIVSLLPSTAQSPAIAIPDTLAAPTAAPGPAHSYATHRTTDIDASADGPEAGDRFARAQVESLPGTLLTIDPAGGPAARLLVLNPFAYHGMLELLFERSVDGVVKLSEIRAVARCRRRDGLYEYERRHINMVLSTISAVVWDVATQS